MAHDTEFFARAAADPEFLLAKLDADLADVDVEELPIVTLSSDEAGEGYRSVRDGRPRHLVVEAILLGQSDRIHEALCVRAGYCAGKVRHRDTVTLMVTVCDAVLSAAIKLPIPAASVSAYCVQSLFLDRFCDCAPASGQTA